MRSRVDAPFSRVTLSVIFEPTDGPLVFRARNGARTTTDKRRSLGWGLTPASRAIMNQHTVRFTSSGSRSARRFGSILRQGPRGDSERVSSRTCNERAAPERFTSARQMTPESGGGNEDGGIVVVPAAVGRNPCLSGWRVSSEPLCSTTPQFCRVMTNRYDQGARHNYGAEGDSKMDAILGALEEASSAPASERVEPTGDDWGRLLAVPRRLAGVLQRVELPEGPGVYFWSRDGAPTYVGTAKSLRKRLSSHLGGGVSLAGSSLRRNVCEMLFQIPPNVTGNPTRQKVTTEQATAIRDWLLGCEVSWLQARSRRTLLAWRLGSGGPFCRR